MSPGSRGELPSDPGFFEQCDNEIVQDDVYGQGNKVGDDAGWPDCQEGISVQNCQPVGIQKDIDEY